MPMFTAHDDSPTPRITQMGQYTTIRWDSGLSIQLDANEWDALIAAVAQAAPMSEPW